MLLPSSNFVNAPFRRGFTLVEVTISVALGLVLMLGVAQVFRVSGDAIGAGQALADALRNARAAQTLLSRDLRGAVRDGAPYLIISNHQVFAFRNRADMLADKDQNASTEDLTGTGVESTIAPTSYGTRSHRTDSFNFFARGNFQRQTGASVTSAGAAPFVAQMSSPEAWLWYGHLKLPDNTGNFGSGTMNAPGQGALTANATYTTGNPNNFFADDWTLGREQLLLRPTSTIGSNGVTLPSLPNPPPYIPDNNNAEQYAFATNSGSTAHYTPLGWQSYAYKSSNPSTGNELMNLAGSASFELDSGRLDLAQTTINTFFQRLTGYIGISLPLAHADWYQSFFYYDGTRFQAIPFITPPITPESLAATSPQLIKGCTQFIVEYAGDFLNQNAAGTVTDSYIHLTQTATTSLLTPPVITAASPGTTDGQIDFYIPTGTTERKIRWYGMPRSTSGKSTITAMNGDVVPLRDLWPVAYGLQAPFEEQIPSKEAATYPDYIAGTNAMAADARYCCAFGPEDPKPKMLRITIVIDDPQGRLGDGQTYEYIFTLP